jgi:hypothetical protein
MNHLINLDKYKAPQKETEKEKLRKDVGFKTTIHLSAIRTKIKEENDKGENINPSRWSANQETIYQLEIVLPKSDSRDSLVAGLQLIVDSKENGTTLTGQEKILADKAEEKLALIKGKLLERGELDQEMKKQEEEHLESVMKSTGKAFDRLGEKIGKLNKLEFTLGASVAFLALTSIIAFLKPKGKKKSVLEVTLRWLAIIGTGGFLISGFNKEDNGVFKKAKDLYFNTTETVNGESETPILERLTNKEINLKSEFAEEIFAVSDVSLKTAIDVWHDNRTKGKISRAELGIPPRFKNKFSDEQLFSLLDTLFQEYPKTLLKFLSSDEREKVRDENGYLLVEKWYETPELEGRVTVSALWMDYLLDQPPPGFEIKNNVMVSKKTGKKHP